MIIDKYFCQFLTSYSRFVMRNIVACHYHLHIQDSIYISRYFLTRIFIRIFHKRNHSHFSREQYLTSVARRWSWGGPVHTRVIPVTLYVTHVLQIELYPKESLVRWLIREGIDDYPLAPGMRIEGAPRVHRTFCPQRQRVR